MKIRRYILSGFVAVFAVAVACAYASGDLAPATGQEQRDNAFWLKTKIPQELLENRLNVTNVAKTAADPFLASNSSAPQKKQARTAQLTP